MINLGQTLALVLLLCLGHASYGQDSASVVSVANERQLQQALDGHKDKKELLQIEVTGTIRLARGVTIPQAAGPIEFKAAGPVKTDADGAPVPSATIDGSRIKPAAPALTIFTLAPVNLTGLTFTGTNGSAAVFAQATGPMTVSNCLFSKNNNTGAYVSKNGGAISCIGCEQLVIQDSKFEANGGDIGGAVYAVNAINGVQLTSTWFIANQGLTNGGSVALGYTSGTVKNCTFFKSQATDKTGWGGAISAHVLSNLVIEDVLFDKCKAGESGGAVQGSTLSVANISRITCLNSTGSWFGGCLFFITNSNVTVRDSVFKNNSAPTAGGALHFDRGSGGQVIDCKFENNTSAFGGAINGQEPGGRLELRRCTFFNNSAGDRGGAFHAECRRFTLEAFDSEFINNTAGMGGAIGCTTARCLVNNCSFTGNSGSQMGGAIWSSSSWALEVNSSSISGNSGVRGGGLCVEAPSKLLLVDTQVINNKADVDGGGVLLVSITNGTADFVRSPVSNNTAALGGGFMLVSAQNITLRDTTVADNSAKISKALVATVDGSFSSAGSGGGIFGTQCGLRLINSRLQGNVADSNGGGAALEKCHTVVEQSVIENNKAADGNGGGISASVAGDAAMLAADTGFYNNAALSGGAVFVSGPTNAVALGKFSCSNCTLRDNHANSKETSLDGGGGGIMATGNIEVSMASSSAQNNTAASGAGGAVHCLQCTSMSLKDCRLANNAAVGPGGAASCKQCDHVTVESLEAEGNRAITGAALYLALTGAAASKEDVAGRGRLGIFNSKFHRNTAGDMASLRLPAGSGSPAAAVPGSLAEGDEDVSGAGGAVVIQNPAPFAIHDSRFSSNEAASSHGGAVYHQACTDGADCMLALNGCSFDENSAKSGGGAVFTTNGTLLQLPEDCSANTANQDDDGSTASNNDTPCRSSRSFRASSNKAAFGADVASTPSRLGVASGSELRWMRQLDRDELFTARRRLLSAPSSTETAAPASQGPAPRVLYLESNNRFDLEVKLLDHWGSNVVSNSSRPTDATIRLVDQGRPAGGAAAVSAAARASNGSLCAQSCEPGRPCVVGCLTGATTLAFKNGLANFSSVGLSAPPNSSLRMHVLPGGLIGVPLADVIIRVHGCGVGERLGSGGGCEPCPAPQINLDPFQSRNCSSCPSGATCPNGFPTPLPGYWHSHPRSMLFHQCPNQAACTPADAGKRMLAYQQLHKHDGLPGWHLNRTAVGEEYMLAQCSTGRSGPLCSSCARGYGLGPGNVCRKCPSSGRAGATIAYLLVRLLDVFLVSSIAMCMLVVWSRAHDNFSGSPSPALPNFDSADSVTSTTALRPVQDASAADNDSSDDTANDPQVLDPQANGPSKDDEASASPASQLALWLLMLLDWHQLAYLIFSAIAPLMASGASMLFALLLTTPQSTLQWVPMDCLVPPQLAGKATTASSVVSSIYPVLLTLASFGVLCLLKPLGNLAGRSHTSKHNRSPAATPAGPGFGPLPLQDPYSPASLPNDTNGHSINGHDHAATSQGHAASNGHTPGSPPGSNGSTRLSLKRLLSPRSSSGGSTRVSSDGGSSGTSSGSCRSNLQHLVVLLAESVRQLGIPGLLIVAAVASLCYCTVDLTATVVGAFQCKPLDPAIAAEQLLPGERRAAQGSWWARNLNLPCYGSSQVTAAAVAGLVSLPLLMFTLALVSIAVQAAIRRRRVAPGNQLYSTWMSKLWSKSGYRFCGLGGGRGQSQGGERGCFSAASSDSRWWESLAAAGVTFVAPFKAMIPSCWWAVVALVFRMVLAVLLTALDNAAGGSVLLRAVVGSGALACIQLLHAWWQPGLTKKMGWTAGGCYLLLQVLCILTVAAESLGPVAPAARAVFYTAIVVVGSINCLYMAYRTFRSLWSCLS